jgi:hexosaminidase
MRSRVRLQRADLLKQKLVDVTNGSALTVWRSAALIVLLMMSACAPARVRQPATPKAMPTLALVPYPRELQATGGAVKLAGGVRIIVAEGASPEIIAATSRWLDEVQSVYPAPSGESFAITLQGSLIAEPESYQLSVQKSGATIRASSDAGLFYGLQTLRQLLDAQAGRALPLVEINDAPRFRYRGMHLDVVRHFFPVSFVKKYIDLMARNKLNTFHWHLTDDQGWRLQIAQYPKLTEVGGCRKETMVAKNFKPYIGDNTHVCGYYTQEEAREVVAYARARFITVIPEIEMPGHATAAVAAYPELACTPGPFEVATYWGVFDDIFCPKEETFAFLDNVFGEVTSLFPSLYIHIGGDEVPKKRWQESALAQDLMKREGLKDEHELQSYFIRRVEKMLNARGRRLIGWDEILEGGLAPDATVMSWRGTEGGIAAAKQGHDVIMTPNSHLYFDHYQGDPATEPLAIGGNSPLQKVYSFDPLPPDLSPSEAQHILGAQANVWTEYIATSAHVEYMVFPRLLALSEVVWTPAALRNWVSFQARLPTRLRELARLGVNYRR